MNSLVYGPACANPRHYSASINNCAEWARRGVGMDPGIYGPALGGCYSWKAAWWQNWEPVDQFISIGPPHSKFQTIIIA